MTAISYFCDSRMRSQEAERSNTIRLGGAIDPGELLSRLTFWLPGAEMRRNQVKKILQQLMPLLIMATVIFASVAPTAIAHSCSVGNIAGTYAYTSTGAIVNPPVGPFAAVGKITFSNSGTLSGEQTTSIGGNFFDETISGSFSVNSDCTATATVNVYHGTVLARTTALNIVFDDDRKGARAIFLTPGTAITVSARRIFTELED